MDPDGYMRLLRVEQLVENGDWYDQNIHIANAPHGHPLPWSRLIDVVIILMMFTADIFVSSSEALFVAGVWFSPLMLVVASLSIVILMRRTSLSEDYLFALCILFLTQPGLMNYFAAARPDHHSCLLALASVHLALLYANLAGNGSTKAFALHGILQGISLWASIETITLWVCAAAAYSLGWLNKTTSGKANFYYHLGVLLTSLFAILLETPWALTEDMTHDRLNRNYLVLVGSVALSWFLLWQIRHHAPLALNGLKSKVFAGIVSMSLCIGMTHLFAGSIWGGPMSAISPELQSIWLDRITEFQPIASTFTELILEGSIWIPSMTIGSIYVVYRIYQLVINKRFPSNRELAWAIHAILFTGLIFYQKRWSAYACIIWIVPVAMTATAFLEITINKCRLRLVGLLAMFLTAVSPILLSLALTVSQADSTAQISSTASKPDVASTGYLDWIETLPEDAIILAPMDLSPEIMFRTKRKTVGGHYHTNPQGIFDTFRVLGSVSDDTARKIIDERGIAYILVDTSPTAAAFYQTDSKGITLHNRLSNNQPPDYCMQVKELGRLIAYKVIHPEN
ncbi:MAG: hypothetical protein AAGH72_10155 [Verrucomicrobiota bacterium]